MTRLKALRPLVGPFAVVVIFLLGVRYSPVEIIRPADPSGAPMGTVSWDDADWTVLERALLLARYTQADTLPMGELMTAVGRSLVGTPYEPRTLEVEGPERLVVNLRALDCVTFVESVFAISVLVKTGAIGRMDDRGGVEGEFERAVRAVRYRNNEIDGYPSRLHYFSEWIGDGEAKALMVDMTAQLGGVPDEDAIDFMSTHPEAYRQLADPAVLEEIVEIERRLAERVRYMIPEDEIAAAASGIQNGDIIAVTSTVDGLDIAHTGLAIWVDGALHLMHAPLVGDSVQISERTLAERIVSIDGQDGIMVARLMEPRPLESRATPVSQ